MCTKYNTQNTSFSFVGKYVIRFTVTSQYTTILDITKDWAEIKATASEIINDENLDTTHNKTRVSLAGNNLYNINQFIRVVIFNTNNIN